jgi:MFS superfamily sulfate permease-like transporter
MLVMAGVCLLGATPARAAGGTGIGSGRLVPTVAAVVGLIGVVLGGLVLARTAGRIGAASGRLGAIVALAAGLISVVVGGLHRPTPPVVSAPATD